MAGHLRHPTGRQPPDLAADGEGEQESEGRGAEGEERARQDPHQVRSQARQAGSGQLLFHDLSVASLICLSKSFSLFVCGCENHPLLSLSLMASFLVEQNADFYSSRKVGCLGPRVVRVPVQPEICFSCCDSTLILSRHS